MTVSRTKKAEAERLADKSPVETDNEVVAQEATLDDAGKNDALLDRVEALAEKGDDLSDAAREKLAAELVKRPIRQHLSNRATDFLDNQQV